MYIIFPFRLFYCLLSVLFGRKMYFHSHCHSLYFKNLKEWKYFIKTCQTFRYSNDVKEVNCEDVPEIVCLSREANLLFLKNGNEFLDLKIITLVY
jgi:hypothetical protein